MDLILNLIWIVFGGLVMAIGWFFAGLVAAITIIGLPWARACFTLASFSLWPFGREAVDRRTLTGREDIGTGPLGMIGNIIWLVFFGIWLALGHIVAAVLCALTIIGLPFGWQHLKLAMASLAPIGMEIVPVGTAEAAMLRRPMY